MKSSILLFSNDSKLDNVFIPSKLKLRIFPLLTSTIGKENLILKFDITTGYFVPVLNYSEETHGIFVIYDGVKIEENNIIRTVLTKVRNSSKKVVLVFHSLPEETTRKKICDLFGGTKGLVLLENALHEHPNNWKSSEYGYTPEQKNKQRIDDCFYYYKVYNALFNLFHGDKSECYFDGEIIHSVDDIIRIAVNKLDKNRNLEIALNFLHKCLEGKNESLPNEFSSCQNEFDIWMRNKTNDHLGNLRDKILKVALGG